MDSELSIIGKALPQPDASAKVTGEARYTVDLKLPDMLIAKILRSPHAHAEIIKIDKSEAEALTGVKAVISFEDVPKTRVNMGKSGLVDRRGELPESQDQYVLSQKARFVGDAVAAVAAVDEATALRALELIKVKHNVLPHLLDPMEALKDDAPKIHDHVENNVGIGHTPRSGSHGFGYSVGQRF